MAFLDFLDLQPDSAAAERQAANIWAQQNGHILYPGYDPLEDYRKAKAAEADRALDMDDMANEVKAFTSTDPATRAMAPAARTDAPAPTQTRSLVYNQMPALTPQQEALQSEITKRTALSDQIVQQLQGLNNPYAVNSPLYQRLLGGAVDDAWSASGGGDRAIAADYAARGMAGSGQAAAAQAAYEGNRANYIDSAQRQAALQLTQLGSDWQNSNLQLQSQIKSGDQTLAALQALSGDVNQNAQYYAGLAQNKDLTTAQMTQQDKQFWADLGLRTEQGNRQADNQAGAGILNAAVMGGAAILPYLIPGLNAAAPLISGAASNAANWLMSSHGTLPNSYFQNNTPQAASAVGKAPAYGITQPSYYGPAYTPTGGSPAKSSYSLQSVGGTPIHPVAQQLTGFRGVQLRR